MDDSRRCLELVSPSDGWTEQVLHAFDGLGPGDSVILSAREDPRSVLRRLQADRSGAFDWSVIEASPARWRVELQRRNAAPRGVTEYLTWDHRRLAGIFAVVRRLLAAAELRDAGLRFAEFATGLQRHIEMEERVVFRVLEGELGKPLHPTIVLRQEHARIRGHLAGATEAFESGQGARTTQTLDALQAALFEHEMKEEEILYPMTDQASGDRRGRIVDDMQVV